MGVLRSMAKKKRRSNGFVDLLNGFLSLLVLAMLIVGGVFLYGLNQFYAAGPAAADTAFLVEPGNGLNTIANRLEEKGLIDNGVLFQVGSQLLKRNVVIKAGEFNIAKGASMADILKEITEGTPVQYAVTVPEGWTSWQVAQRLNEESHRLIGAVDLPPEGSILPNTYNYVPGATRQSVLEAMQTAMTESVAAIFAGCDPTVCGPDQVIKTPDELVILASIVERETGVPTERRQVAAVFINRLKEGMKLQSDPTTIYAITRGQGSLGRGLKKSEIEAVNDYNTYQIDGLPRGPIANPGTESLEAVAHPDAVGYRYFVARTASPSDGHLFAVSYAEHRLNVDKYREAVKQQEIAAEAETDAAKDAIEAEQAAETGEAVSPDAPASDTPPTETPADEPVAPQ